MYSNSTPNFQLPQYTGTDRPEWVGDLNPAFEKIDTVLRETQINAESASNTAAAANVSATNAGTAANNAMSAAQVAQQTANNASTNIAQLTVRVTNLEAANAAVVEQVGTLTFVKMTQTQFDSLEVKNPNTIYFVVADV